MSPDLRPRTRDVAGDVRAAARRQGRDLTGVLAVVPGMVIAAIVMTCFIVLDYTFNQDSHRVVKVAAGIVGLGAIVSMPMFGLMLLPIATPFLSWVPPTPIPGLNPLNVLLFSIFGTFALGRVLQRRPLFRPNHLGSAIGLLLLVCVVSVVRGAAFPTGYGFNALDASLQLFRSATSFATYFIVLAMANGLSDRKRITWAVMLGLLAESVVTVIYGRNGSGSRAIGSIGQSNELGSFLALFAVVALALLPGVKHWLGRVLLAGIFVVASFGIMLSLSRGGMLAFLAGSAIVGWRSSRVWFGVMVVAMLLSPLWAPDYVKERVVSSQIEVEGTDDMTLDMSAEARLQTWQSILQVVSEHPIEGVGFTGLGYVLPEMGTLLGLDEVLDSAHYTYRLVLAEMGILGIILFLWLLLKCWMLADTTVRTARNAFDRALGVGLCGATVSLAVSCAFGDRFFNVVIASSFWMLCALAEDAVSERRRSAA